jgi:hypothetical protein
MHRRCSLTFCRTDGAEVHSAKLVSVHLKELSRPLVETDRQGKYIADCLAGDDVAQLCGGRCACWPKTVCLRMASSNGSASSSSRSAAKG